MKPTIFFGSLYAISALLPASAETDCVKLSLTVKHAVAAEQSKVLELVATEVSAAPNCACEVVKAAIEGSNAKPETVAQIVATAATAAPEQMRLVSQGAVAVAPDGRAQMQAVMAKLDPNCGKTGHSAKSAKRSKAPIGEVAALPNPLDFPGLGPLNPNNIGFGTSGGQPLFPIFPPIIINPPATTGVNPGTPQNPPPA